MLGHERAGGGMLLAQGLRRASPVLPINWLKPATSAARIVARRRVVAMVNPRKSYYTGIAPHLSSCCEVPLGEVVPLTLLAVLVTRPIVDRLANFFEDFLRLVDPPGFFEQQGVTGARFLACVIRDQSGIFIQRSVHLPLLRKAPRVKQVAIGRGVTRIGLAKSFERDLSFVRVSERKQRARQSQHQGGIGFVDPG